MRALARLLALVLLSLVALQVGVSSIALAAPCVGTCDDDGPDGNCAPGCDDCTCCAHARVLIARPQTTDAPTSAAVIHAWPADGEPPSPDPREILRVPRAAD